MRTLRMLMALTAVIFAATGLAHAQGVYLLGVGAANRSMGSAATAAPLNAAGALNYNPASLAGLRTAEMQFGLEFAQPRSKVASEAFGTSGSTDSDAGLSTIPTFAVADKDSSSQFTFGIGFLGVAGFRSDYPASTTNPILLPQQNGGFGRVVGSADFWQVIPAVSYAVTPSTALGVAPMLTIGKIEATPFVFAPRDEQGRYPQATDPNYNYGGGFQVGLFHEGASGINLGLSYKSPQWMESITVNTADEYGVSRRESVDVELPMMVSAGASYTALEQWVFATDVRYVNYTDAAAFGPEGFDSRGALRGLGWNNIFSFSSGIQYSPSDAASFRIGYTYHESPIDGDHAAYNIGAPVILEHVLAVGCSYEFIRDTQLSLSYIHGFENSVSGPIVDPATGPVPGTSVTNTASGDAIAIEVARRWR